MSIKIIDTITTNVLRMIMDLSLRITMATALVARRWPERGPSPIRSAG
ncbi:hypothetical protein QMO56_26675 [Roseomonas sp. E05]|nr:hypothetical protein [Roseomonas sp. E05]MDJ0391679.1 hypothetical protein [Roseomonas sp. E05]